ncbi:Trk system potassium transporter TrkA [Methanohalophilus sp.]|uniref:Trk system potassium transporter TrkA n=1 Tax=Methanohalophilus sp. TaxID=1966352 RepID=UPI00262402D0|nr:Trk system potassium transporter TrkA [Methanohalophilus sp.]MDK2892617.1 trk/ktr system potassium uptake protein [Methanohalophilus sp.]
MKIIIIGGGEVGYHIASSLYQNNDIVVIENDEDACLRIDELDVQVIRGNGANAAILRKILPNTNLLVAVTGSDEVNIVSCMASKLIMQSNPNFKTMARVSNPDYIDSPVAKRTQLGIDVMVCPELSLASEIADILSIPAAIDTERFADGKVMMMEFVVKKDNELVRKKVKDLDLPEGCILSALFRDSELIIPHGDDVILAGDHMVIMGKSNSMMEIPALFGEIGRKKSRIMIIGGGVVGFYLAKLLEHTHLKVKLIEKDKERSEYIAEELSNILVLRGDGTDLNLLKEEGIGDMDVVISVTGSDEKNLLCALLAKQLGAKKVIVRADHYDYVPLFEMVGVDRAASPKEATVNEVLKLTMGTGIAALTTLEGEKVEIIEYTVSPNSRIEGTPLKDVQFPRGAIVSMVVKGNETHVPRGDYVIKAGDHVLIFSLPSVLHEVEKLFK